MLKAEYYEAIVTCTGKGYSPTEKEYQSFDRFTKTFSTPAEVQAWLKEEYGTCKRTKMYIDLAPVGYDNKSEHIGWIYCFNGGDYSHAPVNKWRQQDWVEIRHITAVPAIAEIA